MADPARTRLNDAYQDRRKGKLHPGCSNLGLAFERYISSDGETDPQRPRKEDAKAVVEAFLKGICTAANHVDIYQPAYERWTQSLPVSKTLKKEPIPCSTRVIVGLGNDTLLEVGMTFNRTYGMPIIPGSALKGLCRRYYLKHLNGSGEVKDANGKPVVTAKFYTLFGSTDAGGLITFFDAWCVPTSAPGGPLRQDVITVHHKNYYGKKGATPPTDFDDPTPISFLSATGSFLFAVKGPTPEWTEFAMNLLKIALADYGVGGKTSSGYGRFGENAVRQAPPAARKSDSERLIEEVEKLTSADKGRVGEYVERWRKLPDDEGKVNAAKAFLAAKATIAGRKATWPQEMQEYRSTRGA